MSLSKIKNLFNINKKLFPEIISTNEKFLFEIRNKFINSNRYLSETEAKKLFTTKKYYRLDIFLSGIKNHILEFNNFKNQFLVKIFGYENKKAGISFLNFLVNTLF